MRGAKKHKVKKVIKSKNDLKVVQNFSNLVIIFFHFDKISKMKIQEPKNAFMKGAKKAQGKKSHQIKKWYY